MTLLELRRLTDRKFNFIALDLKDNIMFAVPIPGVNAWRFKSEAEAQAFVWDDEEITACSDAWDKYIKILSSRKNRPRKTIITKLCMDDATKTRLLACAEKQHKSVSQLVTDWIWNHPIKADAE